MPEKFLRCLLIKWSLLTNSKLVASTGKVIVERLWVNPPENMQQTFEKKLFCITAIMQKGLLIMDINERAFNSDSFCGYIDSLLQLLDDNKL